MSIPDGHLLKYVSVDAEKETFLPLATLLEHSQIGAIDAQHIHSERRMMINRPGGKPEPFNQKIAGPVFETNRWFPSCADFLWRRGMRPSSP